MNKMLSSIVVCTLAAVEICQGATIIKHEGANAPTTEGWTRIISEVPPDHLVSEGALSPDPCFPGVDAWQIASYGTAPGQGGSIEYKYVLTPVQRSDAAVLGWTLKARWRLESNVFNWAQSNYVGIRLQDAWYQMRLGYGDALARAVRVFDASWPNSQVELGADGYYTTELVYDPADGMVDFYVDGVLEFTDLAPYGASAVGDVTICFGVNGAGNDSAGVVDYNCIQFDIGISETIISIDPSRQLFLDDYLIESLTNIEREVHQPVKHAQNPLIVADKPWEINSDIREGVVFHSVSWDQATEKFRMWYAGYKGYTLPTGEYVAFPACYAESDDGINWVKPDLGLYEFEGETATNIIIPEGWTTGIIDDPNEPDPNHRYRTLALLSADYATIEGYYMYTSPDGIQWTRQTPLGQPVLESTTDYSGAGIGDTSSFRWDPWLNKYVGDVKLFPGYKFRYFGQIESDDFVNWTDPVTTVYPDAFDACDVQIYQHRPFNYESMWIGLLRVYHENLTPSRKQTPIELTASRNGRNWQRVGTRGGLGEGRQEFMSVDDSGDWDDNYLDAAPPILIGDELWFYYRGARLAPAGVDLMQSHKIGLATLRRDGFVSMNAGPEPGTLVTKPLEWDQRQTGRSILYVNAEVGQGGYLKVSVSDAEAGSVIEGYSLAECNGVTGDQLAAAVTWGEHDTIDYAPATIPYLTFEMQNAKLYAFWLVDGPPPPVCSVADLNEDCEVDHQDLVILAEHWLESTAP